MHTGQPNPQSMIDEYNSGKIIIGRIHIKYLFLALNVSNDFATIDYEAYLNTKIYYTINHVFLYDCTKTEYPSYSLRTRTKSTSYNTCNVSTKHQFSGFLLTGNRSNFLYVEGSTAWSYDCPHFLSLLYKADRCFDRIPIHFKDTLL